MKTCRQRRRQSKLESLRKQNPPFSQKTRTSARDKRVITKNFGNIVFFKTLKAPLSKCNCEAVTSNTKLAKAILTEPVHGQMTIEARSFASSPAEHCKRKQSLTRSGTSAPLHSACSPAVRLSTRCDHMHITRDLSYMPHAGISPRTLPMRKTWHVTIQPFRQEALTRSVLANHDWSIFQTDLRPISSTLSPVTKRSRPTRTCDPQQGRGSIPGNGGKQEVGI